MNILDAAIAGRIAASGGGGGTDDYNDLLHLPEINDVTLSGNKSSSALGLQSEITSENKLDSDLIDDTDQDNKFVTSTEKNTWNAKQNAIDADHKISADYVDDSTSTNKFVTASDKETWNAKQNAIDNSHKLSSDLVDDANHTNKFVTSTEKQTWNAKQNAIDSDHKLSSSLVSFSEAEAAAIASGIDSSKVGQISTNQTNILYTLNKVGKNLLNSYDTLTDYVSHRGIVYSNNKDGTWHINGTSDSDNSYIDLYEFTSGLPWGIKAGDKLVVTSSSNNVGVRFIEYTNGGTGQKVTGYLSNPQEVTISANTTGFLLRFTVETSGTAVNDEDVIGMICHKEAWDQDTTIEKYGASNSELTKLGSENRAALVECVDEGVKNLLNLDDCIITSSDAALTFTRSGNVLTISNTGTSQCSIKIENLNLPLNTQLIISGCPSGGSESTYQIDYTDNGTYVQSQTPDFGNGSDIVTFTSMSNSWIRIRIAANTPLTNKVFSIMVCTLADWKISQNFAPYALPNYDLTRLEAEDRAALINAIDNGAKNSFNPNAVTLENMTEGADSYSYQSDATDSLTYFRFKLYAYQNSNAVRELYQASPLSTGAFSCTFTKASDFNRVAIGHNGQTTSLRIFVDVSNLTDGKEYTLSLNVTAANPSVSLAWNSTMICTTEEWAISQKFVPYILPLDQRAPALMTSVVSSGSLDDITISTYALYHPDVTGKPESNKYAFCRTDVFDSTSAIQHLTYASDPFGKSYVRVKSGGTWRSWLQTTNA